VFDDTCFDDACSDDACSDDACSEKNAPTPSGLFSPIFYTKTAKIPFYNADGRPIPALPPVFLHENLPLKSPAFSGCQQKSPTGKYSFTEK